MSETTTTTGWGQPKTSNDFERERRCGRHVMVGSTAAWTKPCAKPGRYVAVKLSPYADLFTNGVVCRYHAAAIKGGRGSVGADYKSGIVGLLPIEEVSDEQLPAMLTYAYIHDEEEED